MRFLHRFAPPLIEPSEPSEPPAPAAPPEPPVFNWTIGEHSYVLSFLPTAY